VTRDRGRIGLGRGHGPARRPPGRARRLYEIAGWTADGAERTSAVFGATVPEVRYRRRSTNEESSSATPAGTE
jgi:hypothetical protein